MISDILQAFVAPFKGAKLIISDKKLFALSVVPIIIDFLLLVILGVILFLHLDNLVYALIGHPASTITWIIAILLFVLFGALAIALCALLLVIVGTILLSPFLDAISARTEKMFAGALSEEAGGILQAFRDISRSVKNAIKMLLFVVAIYLVLLPLNLIPLVGNIIYAIISAFVSFVLLGWEFLDFTWDRWRWTFRDKKEFVKKNLLSVAALGFSISFLLIIPVINLALMPAAACGATIWAIGMRGKN